MTRRLWSLATVALAVVVLSSPGKATDVQTSTTESCLQHRNQQVDLKAAALSGDVGVVVALENAPAETRTIQTNNAPIANAYVFDCYHAIVHRARLTNPFVIHSGQREVLSDVELLNFLPPYSQVILCIEPTKPLSQLFQTRAPGDYFVVSSYFLRTPDAVTDETVLVAGVGYRDSDLEYMTEAVDAAVDATLEALSN